MGNVFETLVNSMPAFDSDKDLKLRVDELQDYLFQLLEYLKYLMYNLDPSRNFNEAAAAEFAGLITEPVYARIEDEAGNVAQLALTAEGLQTQFTNMEGDMSTLQQTAKGLQVQVSDMYGNISTLQQTSNGIQTQVSNLQGQVSQVQQSAAGIMSTVRNLEGQYSRMAQTVNGWTFTTINGTTYIDGSKIYTGTLSADAINTANISSIGNRNSPMEIFGYGINLSGGAIGFDAQAYYFYGSGGTVFGTGQVDMGNTSNVFLPHNSQVFVGTNQGEKTLYEFVRMVIDGA